MLGLWIGGYQELLICLAVYKENIRSNKRINELIDIKCTNITK